LISTAKAEFEYVLFCPARAITNTADTVVEGRGRMRREEEEGGGRRRRRKRRRKGRCPTGVHHRQ
jgi:hypothetical protein